ncbi:uncharacterized protein N7479_007185 [Penicillium vulpinum]|uniref:uncharacterized protein n=1 Tax=Penicillium vulpinum TaxID=29845 RepID=UPI002548BBE9|nr:uncharacterized protein N7479_007185 [Penicillium vulpinum]KAJ5960035.1 hypothetical protein N7479_007185 [Penicillium vulpinum]
MPLRADSSSLREEVRSPIVATKKVETVILEKDKKGKEKNRIKLHCSDKEPTRASVNPSEALSSSETEISIKKNVIQPGFSWAIQRHRRGPGPNS